MEEQKENSTSNKTARKYNSPIIQELLDEITPEEMEATKQRMLQELVDNQEDLDPEFGQIINDNFWELTDDQTDAWELTDDKTESPYCPVCDACGEDGCCSAINCKQDPNGHYCGTYLNDLKFGYKMDQWVADNLYHKMPKELQAEYDLAWDKLWDEIYNNKAKGDNNEQ